MTAKKRNSPPAERRIARITVSRRRLWFFRLTVLVLPVLFFALLELSLRVAGYGYNPHFFKRLKIGSEEFFVQNEDFSYRFFPQENRAQSRPRPVSRPQSAGHVSHFYLGGVGCDGDPAQSFAPDRYLEVLLREKYLGSRFEVINVAFTAINSHVILPIARECATQEADLWIIYMGNNEMVGPFGAATVFGSQAPPRPYVRLVLAIQRLRIGQWIMESLRRFSAPGEKAPGWGGMAMFLQNQVAPDSPRKATVYRNFQDNLNDIVRAGINSGAKVLLNTVAVNLKDCPPVASMTNSQLSQSDRVQFEQLYANGMTAAAQNEFAKGAEFFELAAQLHANSAELQFHWADCLLKQTNFAVAREHFQLACDQDTLPFRADSRINAVIRSQPEKIQDKNLILLDTAAVLSTRNETGLCGQETFYEHVHFDFDGRYQLGRAWGNKLKRCYRTTPTPGFPRPFAIKRWACPRGTARKSFILCSSESKCLP